MLVRGFALGSSRALVERATSSILPAMLRRLGAILLPLVLTACSTSTEGDDELADASGSTSTGESSPDTEMGESGETGEDPSWERVVQADASLGALMSVWGPSASEVYAVGGQPEPEGRATVLRFDGTTWSEEATPEGAAMLDWVFGVDDRVWAVGRAGTILVREAGTWASETSPTSRTLWGVWGASADELWAVGGDGTSDPPVLLRRDGASESWSEVELPALSVDTHGLFKVWGSAADDVWIVGDVGASLHYDGVAWTDYSTSDNVDLISVWGSPSEGIVGVGGRASGRIVRVVDGAWVGETYELPGFNGVWVSSEGTTTVVGNMGKILRVAAGGFEIVEETSGTPLVLHAVFGLDDGTRYAVGGSLLAAPPYTGVVLRSLP